MVIEPKLSTGAQPPDSKRAEAANAPNTRANQDVAVQRSPDDQWRQVEDLACGLSVELPLPGFHIEDLLSLVEQSVIDTHWVVGSDVPLRVNGELLAWCEFEAVDKHLAVRLTELA